MYNLIQISQVVDEFVHHVRFITGRRTEPDLPENKEKEGQKHEQVFEKVFIWLRDQGFTGIRQGFLGFPKDLRCIETYLPKEFYPEKT